MSEAAAIKQHDTGRIISVPALGSVAHAAEDCSALHVAIQQLADIGEGKDVGVDDRGSPLIIHELWRKESQRGERLQVAHIPGANRSAPLESLTLPSGQPGIVFGMNDSHAEAVWPAGVPPQRMRCHQGTDDLLFISVDEDTRLQLCASRFAIRYVPPVSSQTEIGVSTATEELAVRHGHHAAARPFSIR